MLVKTSELVGPALDWAVAKCEGNMNSHGRVLSLSRWRPSTNWAQGGPIIERYGCFPKLERQGLYVANVFNGVAYVHTQFGPTPLIAAMRCFCASRLGDTVDIPDELL